MNIIVSKDNLQSSFDDIILNNTFGLDTETEGLQPYNGDRIFSIIISTYAANYYFNFNKNAPEENQLDRKKVLSFLARLLRDEDNTFYIANAKFDLHFLHVENVGISFRARIICVLSMARLVHNQLPSYSLAAIGELIGVPKDDTVEKYISKHKLYTLVNVGKKKPRKDKHFDKVPFNIIVPYGCRDGACVFAAVFYVMNRLKEINKEQTAIGLPSNVPLVENEIQLTKTLFKMESIGVKIDRAYCEEALEYEEEQYTEAMNKFYAFTDGIEFEDSAKCFKLAFKKLGLTPGITDKGNPSYSEENLPDNELTKIILQYRKHFKRAGTYFKNYLILADDNDVIHCNFRQGGAATGRLSSNNPNLQNVPKRGEDNSKYPVRRAFIPRPDHMFLMVDWDQMEYRLMVDVANETQLIKQVNEGLDVHQAAANLLNDPREPAKNLNFMLLYGGGAQKLADKLGITLVKAKLLKAKYFRTLRQVQKLIKDIIQTSKNRGYITNWFGRRLLTVRGKEYAMPNHYIQGGCADVAKIAMNKVDDYIVNEDINMLLTVHDELIFELPIKSYANIPMGIKHIMENTYPHKHLQLTAGIEYSETDWFNKRKY